MEIDGSLSKEIREFDLPIPSPRPIQSPVPPRALAISFAALGVAIVGGTLPAEVLGSYRALTWSLALIPALLLAYHRSWRVVTVLLGLGMAGLALSPVTAYFLDFEGTDWPYSVVVLAVYISIALGGGWFSELQGAMRDLRRMQSELQMAYFQLEASHQELQKTHLQIIRTNQLDTTGQLAAGVAHEVKNPLMTLLTGIQYLRTYAKVEGEGEETLLDDMWLAVKRADSVVRGLLDFSREQELFLKEDQPNDLVARTLGLVKHEIDRHRVLLHLDLEEDLPMVRLDSYRIQQVLINLITNAIDAMADGGTLTLKTCRAGIPVPSQGEAEPTGEKERMEGLAFIVEDSGPGIPAEVIEKVFEPFFTTKGPGKGTGLGLAVSQRLVRMHGGTLALENRPGGARATVLLPGNPEGVKSG